MHKIYIIIKFESWQTLIIQNLYIFDTSHIIKISSILYSIYIISKDQKKAIFYVNNYIQ